MAAVTWEVRIEAEERHDGRHPGGWCLVVGVCVQYTGGRSDVERK
jgi:hypothetical protein